MNECCSHMVFNLQRLKNGCPWAHLTHCKEVSRNGDRAESQGLETWRRGSYLREKKPIFPGGVLKVKANPDYLT